MKRADVIGNVRIVFYPEEKDSTIMGANVSEASILKMYFKDKKMEKAVLMREPKGTFSPLAQLTPDKLKLPNFAWLDFIRPLNKDDLFEWRGKKTEQVLKNKGRKAIPLPNHGVAK